MMTIIKKIIRYFEGLTPPFPQVDSLETPPNTLWAFVKYHIRGYEKILILAAIFNIVYAILEVSLFAFLGRLVDWLTEHSRDTFLQEEFWYLVAMGAMLLVAMPLVSLVSGLLRYQSVMSNFPMAIRWRSHRNLLQQSMSFYQDEFAGRVATKVMQTALSVREMVNRVIQIFIYMSVSFLSMLLILWSIDFWLMFPMLIWSVIYTLLLIFFLPKLRAASQEQSHARSTMTGRVVDAYSNIATVKLFALFKLCFNFFCSS